MIRTQESTGKTVDEARAKACALLGVQADDLNVSYEVLEMPQKTGFLGLKTTPAKVRVSVELPDAPAAAPAKPVAEQPVETAAPVQETAPVAEEVPAAVAEPAAPAAEQPAAQRALRRRTPVRRTQPPDAEQAEQKRRGNQRTRCGKGKRTDAVGRRRLRHEAQSPNQRRNQQKHDAAKLPHAKTPSLISKYLPSTLRRESYIFSHAATPTPRFPILVCAWCAQGRRQLAALRQKRVFPRPIDAGDGRETSLFVQNIYYYTKADRRSQFPKRLPMRPPRLLAAYRNESGHKRCGGIWQSARRNAGRLAEEVLPPRHSSAGSICPFSPKPKRRRGCAAAVVPYAAPAPSTAPRLPLPRRRTAASGGRDGSECRPFEIISIRRRCAAAGTETVLPFFPH